MSSSEFAGGQQDTLVIRMDTVRAKGQRLTWAGGATMVWILLILGVVVGLAIMGAPSDTGCAAGWLFILLVVVLGFVILTGTH